LFLNSISRSLVLQGRRSGLKVKTHLGVSPLEALIAYVGLDVAGYGLQVYTATKLATGTVRPVPSTPLAVMEVAAVGAETAGMDPIADPQRFRPLLRALARTYPPDHRATMVNVTDDTSRRSHATLPLRRFPEFIPGVRENSHLFIDAVRTETAASKEGHHGA
jgi:hypothetical protein